MDPDPRRRSGPRSPVFVEPRLLTNRAGGIIILLCVLSFVPFCTVIRRG